MLSFCSTCLKVNILSLPTTRGAFTSMLSLTEFYLSEFTVNPFSTMWQQRDFLGANKSHDASQGSKEANAKFALKNNILVP
jgi:hypothetical protein